MKFAVIVKAVLLFSSFPVISCEKNSTLKQIFVLFRHGERSPTETYPNDPHKEYKWPNGLGQLSNRGKMQMYTLGTILKQDYNNFLPEYYTDLNVSLWSSYAERCLMSAELLAAGLFPPVKKQIWNEDLLWQPIPVHYVPRGQDNFIAMKQSCEKYDQEYKELLSSKSVEKMKEENSELLKYVQKHTGVKTVDFRVIETIFNTLEIEQLNNLTLPDWVSDEVLEKMKSIGAKNLALYSESVYMKKMKGGVLLKRIITDMEKLKNKKIVPTVNLFAGHDLSIVHFLRALDIIDTLKPDFGASVILELHKNPKYQVKIFYRDDYRSAPEEKVLPGCDSPCDFEKFQDILKPVIPENYSDECK